MKTYTYTEGPEAATNFQNAMRRLLTFPKTELLRREAEYKKLADANPKKRGPKKKGKSND